MMDSNRPPGGPDERAGGFRNPARTARHLTPEALARLVDEAPAPDEAAHLAACAPCTRELDGLRDQTRGLGDLPTLSPPSDAWEAIEARLDRERVGSAHAGSAWAAPMRRPWIRLAAGLLLFLAGAAVGGWAARSPGPGASLEIAFEGGDPARLATDLALGRDLSLDEAEAFVRRTQELQLAALLVYRDAVEREGGTATADPLTRVALYDHLLAAAEAAIRESPADPFLNGIFVTTIAEREIAMDELALAWAGGSPGVLDLLPAPESLP